MFLYPYKIFALSKNKILFNKDNPLRKRGIYDVESMNYNTALESKEKITDSCISVLLGEVRPGVYLNVWDLDDCFDDNGELEEETKELLDLFDDSEWEVSSRGKGIHIYTLTRKKYQTFMPKGFKGCKKAFEFYADKRHIVTTTFDFVNTDLKIGKYDDLLDSIYEEYLSAQEKPSMVEMVKEVFEGQIDNDMSKARGAILGREPITDMYKLRGCGYKDERLIELIDADPTSVDQSSWDCSLIAKLLYYTLSYEGAWELATKTNYYKAKDERHKKKFNNPTYRQRTNSYIQKGRF